MGVVSWLVLGALAGWIAGLITGRRGQGCIFTTTIGIIGAFVGAALANLARIDNVEVDDLSIESVAVAVLGAVLLLVLSGAINKRS